MGNFVTLGRYNDIPLADIICGRLCAEGLDAVINDDMSALSVDATVIGIGGVCIRVPAGQAEQAARILKEIERNAEPESE